MKSRRPAPLQFLFEGKGLGTEAIFRGDGPGRRPIRMAETFSQIRGDILMSDLALTGKKRINSSRNS